MTCGGDNQISELIKSMEGKTNVVLQVYAVEEEIEFVVVDTDVLDLIVYGDVFSRVTTEAASAPRLFMANFSCFFDRSYRQLLDYSLRNLNNEKEKKKKSGL